MDDFTVNERLLLPEGTPPGQARAVMCDDDLITVGAGAGTGKTWVLSARFARLLLADRECLPQNILTLTFTEAAAREMQDRIRKRALGLLAQQPAEERREWQSVEEGFDETWISTIHSFAARLIRESGLALDIDPRSSAVSAPQEDAFWGALERALESLELRDFAAYSDRGFLDLAQKLENDPVLIAALEKWGPAVLRALSRDVIELHASLGHAPKTLLAWADEAEGEDDPQAKSMSKAVAEILRPQWNEAWELWRTIFNSFRGEIVEAREKVLKEKASKKEPAKRENPVIPLAELLDRWSAPLNAGDGAVDVQRLFFLDLCEKLTGGNSKLFRALGDRLGQTVTKWRDARKEWAELSKFSHLTPPIGAERRLRAVLLRLFALAWVTWEGTKRRRSLLSFTDMIRFAARSIRADERTKGFKHVLIDEFQDTDPLQNSMIRALQAKERAKLFVVGDPKQAIYRFRHADLTLFADTVLQSRLSGSDIALNVSFRTRETLLRPINSLFAYIWKDGLGASERMSRLKFEPLDPPESSPPERELATVTPFTLLLSLRRERSGAESRERLARSLAQTFSRWVGEGRTVWDRREGLRPVRWKDFAVLTPTRGEYEVLETAFGKENVPVAFEKSTSYFSRGEITDVVNTLRAAAFPADETALAGWLASPFSGVSQTAATECLNIRTIAVRDRKKAEPVPSLLDIVREQLPEAAERLFRLQRLGSLKGPSALLSHLLEDRTWLAAFSAAQRLRVLSNVNRAVTVAAGYESGISPSLAGCAQWLDGALRAQQPVEEPKWMDEDADAVRVLTVHGAKGLEFPVVAVMQMNRGPGSAPRTSVAPSKTMGVVFSDVPDMMKVPGNDEDGGEEAPRSLKWERALEAQSELEESARLFYVAATRARDALILCGVVSENNKGERSVKKESWLEWTLDWLAEERGCGRFDLEGAPLAWAEEDAEETPPSRADVGGISDLAASASDGRKFSDRLSLPGTENIVLSSLSATSYALFEWCPFAWRRRHRQGLDLRWESPDAPDDVPGGSLLGTLAHHILAGWDMNPESLDAWLDDSATAGRTPAVVLRLPAFLRDTWRDARNRATLKSWLGDFSRSGEGQALTEAARNDVLQRESAFCVSLGDLDLVGAIDALWREDGQWHVRDYKITLSDNAPGELYRAQLGFYALVVKLLAEKRELPFEGVDVGLVFLREGGRPGDARSFGKDDDWTTMETQIQAAAQIAAQGPWVPRREHCRFCPWKKGCENRER
ncbi:MAG: UvrD-helicase domain-containing protein [Synergistaceae bacterium]|jgi:ATP-dependent exoDNAse (exonuclease V) beta subunit|nr:UvrD-helicase domain-containing protein [Synergistaceae bacterium]